MIVNKTKVGKNMKKNIIAGVISIGMISTMCFVVLYIKIEETRRGMTSMIIYEKCEDLYPFIPQNKRDYQMAIREINAPKYTAGSYNLMPPVSVLNFIGFNFGKKNKMLKECVNKATETWTKTFASINNHEGMDKISEKIKEKQKEGMDIFLKNKNTVN